MQADLRLKQAQGAWETPRNIAILAGTVAAVVGVLAGVAGWKIGQVPAAPPAQQIVLPPGTVIQIPGAQNAR